MPEIHIDTFDIDILIDRIIDFLKKKKVNQIVLNYFSLDDKKGEIKEIVKIDKLKEKVIKLYDADDCQFSFEIISCNFSYGWSEFVIKFPEEFKNDLKVFEKDLLSL